MRKEHAESLMIASTSVAHGLSVVMLLIEEYLEGEEKANFRRAIADIGGRFYTEVEEPILTQFPELTPAHLR